MNEVVDGTAISFALRFPRPVDHERSRVVLSTPEGRRPLRPRLESRPNTLFVALGRLEPGAYALQWEAILPGGRIARGQVAFSVAAPGMVPVSRSSDAADAACGS